MIIHDKEKKTIKNSVGELLPYTAELINKVELQGRGVYLNDELEWNKSLNEVINILRVERDFKIVKADYYFLSDTTKLLTTAGKAEVKAKRDALREITKNIETVDQALLKLKNI